MNQHLLKIFECKEIKRLGTFKEVEIDKDEDENAILDFKRVQRTKLHKLYAKEMRNVKLMEPSVLKTLKEEHD